MNIHIHVFVCTYVFISLGCIYLGVELLGHIVTLFNVLRPIISHLNKECNLLNNRRYTRFTLIILYEMIFHIVVFHLVWLYVVLTFTSYKEALCNNRKLLKYSILAIYAEKIGDILLKRILLLIIHIVWNNLEGTKPNRNLRLWKNFLVTNQSLYNVYHKK